MSYDLSPLFLTFKLAIITTIILICLGIPLAYWLTLTRSRLKYIIETLVSMPLVLPPTVLGFYLLIALGPHSFVGKFFESIFDLRLIFSFTGLVIGSVIFSLPFMVNPIKAGLQSIPILLTETAYTLGKSKQEILFKVLLPNIKPSLLTGIVMSFAHTLGEFGVVLMIGGSIPGVTKVASIAIFENVEALNYQGANFYSLMLVGISFVILLTLYWLNRKHEKLF